MWAEGENENEDENERRRSLATARSGIFFKDVGMASISLTY